MREQQDLGTAPLTREAQAGWIGMLGARYLDSTVNRVLSLVENRRTQNQKRNPFDDTEYHEADNQKPGLMTWKANKSISE